MKAEHIIIIIIILCLPFTLFGQDTSSRQKHFNLSKGIALQGYDAVSYFNGKPVEGKSDNKYIYKGITYMFSNPSNLEVFKANPERYEPVYGGWCAYAMGDSGEKVKVDPETYKIIDGKLYLFYNFWGNNTLTGWNKNEAKLKSAANLNWKKITP